MITVYDKNSFISVHPLESSSIPNSVYETGFMWWKGKLREVRDIHEIGGDKQIELYDY